MVVFKCVDLNALCNHRYRQADRIRPSPLDEEMQPSFLLFVVPAKAGTQGLGGRSICPWTPAFAGATVTVGKTHFNLSQAGTVLRNKVATGLPQ
jgi:hypothetical protein